MLIVGMVVVGCNGGGDSVRGVVVSIEGALDNVTGFELVDETGARLQFAVDPNAEFDGFPLSHLNDHLLSAEPIVVTYEERGGLYALSIRDG